MQEQSSFSVKLFYSYSHKDAKHKEEMEKYLSLLRNQDKILKTWSDECIRPGQNISASIIKEIESSDIIVFLLSQEFIASKACMEEWHRSCDIAKKKPHVIRIPIILSECTWKKVNGMPDLKALPKDGTPIIEYEHASKAWNQIYDGLKDIIEDLRNQFTMKETFRKEMEKTEFFSQENIKLSDIFVFPSIRSYNMKGSTDDPEKTIKEIRNENDLLGNDYILIHGDRLSGKTTLCRHLLFTLADSGKPVLYIDLLKKTGTSARESVFAQEYEQQFRGDYTLWKNQKDKVIIFDNLSLDTIKYVILAMELFDKVILSVSSDIFHAYYNDDSRLSQFSEARILPLTHSKQEKLIRRRASMLNVDKSVLDGDIDRLENHVNTVIISKRIFPRYPFFVLSILQTSEGYMKQNLSITSYAHCYYIIIISHLMKSGISGADDEINTCFNFAENFAYAIYKYESNRIDSNDRSEFVNDFIDEYQKEFILSNSILNRMAHSQYGIFDGDWFFTRPYMYYYFLGRYFANNIKKDKQIVSLIEDMINTSYLAASRLTLTFLIHHTTDDDLIDDILLRTMYSLDKIQTSTLDQTEVAIFRSLLNDVKSDVLSDESVDVERDKERRIRDYEEEGDDDEEFDGSEISVINDMYRIMKNNEILRQILHSKYGNLQQTKVAEIIETIIDGGLRIIGLFMFNQEQLHELAIFISQKYPDLESDPVELKKILSKHLFYFTMFNIERIVFALNKPQIITLVNKIVREKDTPAYDLIGYFLRLDTMREFSNDDRETLRKLIKKHNYFFFKTVVSIRTQVYLNTHRLKPLLEQSVCDLLNIRHKKRVKRLDQPSKKNKQVGGS